MVGLVVCATDTAINPAFAMPYEADRISEPYLNAIESPLGNVFISWISFRRRPSFSSPFFM